MLHISSAQRAIYSRDEYQTMLQVGMDVDWAKTNHGRKYAVKSRNSSVNVPLIFKERGLSHVRIRVAEYDLTAAHEKTGMNLLDEIEKLVDECLAADLIPIVAFQAEGFKTDPTSEAEAIRVVNWWQSVATRLEARDYRLSYNLIIETTEDVRFHNDRLNELYQNITDAIRATDEHRILIIAPNKISSPFELKDLVVPDDEYVMVEWHFYAAGPQRDNPRRQWTTGTNSEQELVLEKVRVAHEWSVVKGIPTWVGAWMASNYNKDGGGSSEGYPTGGDYTIAEQQVFAEFMSRTLQDYDIPHAVNSDTKFYDRQANAWFPEMEALLDIIVRDYDARR
ncbi:unnamed protein product [Chondrus crispus]|uniref:Glycoside hydrolase family 5 domain-containing protein n=1 Tax=Chondrus crispus TaxID=2769 RepID=R7QPR6_CHOCR|nr:unnamed protein product [Chondrus crispus]CDF40089.1 unnamed protein product [Chondrus crispus]|eukprot:XP_005710383.1 unnamed protein product [Chondrus crispus]